MFFEFASILSKLDSRAEGRQSGHKRQQVVECGELSVRLISFVDPISWIVVVEPRVDRAGSECAWSS